LRTRLASELTPYDYQVVRDNFVWPDHIARLLTTAGIVAWFGPGTVCDPACGDASILEAAYRLRPFVSAILGDISVPQIEALRPSFPAKLRFGTAIETLGDLPDKSVDVVVLTEILEHVEDPETLLREARRVGGALVASSPIDEVPGTGNHEHVWSYSTGDYFDMLREAGWNPVISQMLELPGYVYRFQTWGCR